MARPLGVVSVEEVSASRRVDHVSEEVVYISQVPQQSFRLRYAVLGHSSPVLATNSIDFVVDQAQVPEVFLYSAARAWDDLEDCVAYRYAEVLEQDGVLRGGHEEQVDHPVADVVLHPPECPFQVARGEVRLKAGRRCYARRYISARKKRD